MQGVLIDCLMFVAVCSIVGNPMICGSNAGAGECAAALPPATVPFPLDSTPGGSSEHSSFLFSMLLAPTSLHAFSAFSRGAWRAMHASLPLPLLLCSCLAV